MHQKWLFEIENRKKISG